MHLFLLQLGRIFKLSPRAVESEPAQAILDDCSWSKELYAWSRSLKFGLRFHNPGFLWLRGVAMNLPKLFESSSKRKES